MSAATVLIKVVWPEGPLKRARFGEAEMACLCKQVVFTGAQAAESSYLLLKQGRPSCVIVCKFSRLCPCRRLPVSEDSFKWIVLIQRSETVLQLLPWVICWWLVSTAHAYVIGMSTSMLYRGWKLGDMALWTSLRANQVAQRSLRRGRKLLSYLLDSPKSRLCILLSTYFRCLFVNLLFNEFVIFLLVLEKYLVD